MSDTLSINNTINCPLCGYLITDLNDYELDDMETRIVECPSCDDEFNLTMELSISWTAESIQENADA